MANRASEAAKAIRNEMNRMRGLQAAVDYLEDLGAIETAIDEATRRERQVAEDLERRRDNAKKELDVLTKKITADRLKNKNELITTENKAKQMIVDADTKARAVIKNADEQAKAVLDSAAVKSNQAKEINEQYLREAEVEKRMLQDDVAALSREKDTKQKEVETLETKLAKIKKQISKLIED